LTAEGRPLFRRLGYGPVSARFYWDRVGLFFRRLPGDGRIVA